MGKGHVLAEFEPLGSFQDVSRLCGSARAARQHLLVDAMCFVHDHISIMSQTALQDMASGRYGRLVESIRHCCGRPATCYEVPCPLHIRWNAITPWRQGGR